MQALPRKQMFHNMSCLYYFLMFLVSGCKSDGVMVDEKDFAPLSITVNGQVNASYYYVDSSNPHIRIEFSDALQPASIASSISFWNDANERLTLQHSIENGRILWLTPVDSIHTFHHYTVYINTQLESINSKKLNQAIQFTLVGPLPDKPLIPLPNDDSLMTLVQQKHFRYFWEFSHPISGLARERNRSGDVCTIGGSGFGIMALLVAIERGFISRLDGLNHLDKMTLFLENKVNRYHGAFPHWFNGTTGATIPFSTYDDGADLVETSYLMMGLLCARQYFSSNNNQEENLRKRIQQLFEQVEWNYFTRQQNVLYWHWSPNHQWKMNFKIQGWNEALITYVLAASSPSYPIDKNTYEQGWAQNGSIRNGNSYYGISLPLGPPNGGPLFFAHYSFLGIDPNGLKDQYADYAIQTKNHSLINHFYCIANPKKYFGYSDRCWGLTASDNPSGYAAHEPNHDLGVISPTAALSSMPFTPTESMQAMRYFYAYLGPKIWKEYGFVDAFNLGRSWYADTFLAIDQGPIIIMIENHRSQLLWKLFTSCPEVETGMKNLGFTAPYL